MTSGGHARSGPAPSPGSGRSDARGLTFKTLPAEGYQGEIPEYPQPLVFGNEMHYWNKAWRMPQAALWSTPQWSWIEMTVADWCSAKSQAENPEAPIAVRSTIKSLEAKMLLDGVELARSGYVISTDELADKRADKPADRPLSARDRAKRLRAVGDDK